MRKRFHRGGKSAPELDITAFMNLMVILVPFLLMTAVFSQVNIVEMNLPQASDEAAEPPQDKPDFQLEIVLRESGLEVSDKPGQLLKRFPKTGEAYDIKGLSELLRELKARFPEEQSGVLLLEPDVAYEHMIQVMDTIRVVEQKNGDKLVQYELFPDIALGDAPEVSP